MALDPTRTVYIGQLPFDATEQQLIDHCQPVGRVQNIRIVYDQKNGQPKGYAYCEYSDPAEAKSAVRNLNNEMFRGRSLIIAYVNTPEQRQKFSMAFGGGGDGSMGKKQQPMDPTKQAQKSKGVEAITKMVQSLRQEQLIEMLSEMKTFIEKDRKAAKQLLVDTPQLAQMMLQIQLAFGLIKGNQLRLLYKQQQQQQQQQQKRAPAAAPQQQRMGSNQQQGWRGGRGMDGGVRGNMMGGGGMRNTGHSQRQGGYNMAVSSGRLGGGGGGGGGSGGRRNDPTAEQKRLLETVMRMNPEQIAKQPPEIQAKIRKLKMVLRQRS